ncbi:conserved hypothetical protein, secreted [Candidatus Thiomargarita nelsonii]|uniref:Secreted protein n=1 Tax=Candidatus Thiomargarita nelsonii TaxID=1003181 RepID=A0A0A6P1J6_9GAMM|nr:conserved hypothetical protein, secreted [Candidatus Thiomargarita nelsonii]
MKKLLFVLSFLVMANPAIADTWTSSFSEEGKAKALCPSTNALRGIQCTGRYCDNISLGCGSLGNFKVKKDWWTRSISEEKRGGKDTVDDIVVRINNNMQRCGTKGYVAGMSCKGKYCDNISLYCKEFRNKTPHSCKWTGWISEERGGKLVFGSGKYAVAVKCKGKFCDQKKFLVCH